MGRELVGSLPLSVIPLRFWEDKLDQDFWITLDDNNYLVEDVGTPLEKMGSPFLPDWGIRGHYSHSTISKGYFYIDPTGPETLYITLIRKEPITKDAYYISESLWRGYWEDNKQGYLFQITKTL